MPESPVRVVLANDDRIIIEGLRSMLVPYNDDVVVVGTADGEPEIVMAPDTEEDADVMLIDTFQRRAAGLDAAKAVLAQEPPFAVAVFTYADDLRLLLQALRMGVRGYLLKSAAPEELVDALKRLAAGETVIAPRLATEAARLTQREAELLTLLCQGFSPQQAADEMQISSQTIRIHTRNLYRKLGVTDPSAAVAIARREGLVR
jgi:DNA-binding NarL/FixJ family response regulator